VLGILEHVYNTYSCETTIHASYSLVLTQWQVVSPGEQLGPGQIYDSNRTTLMAALREQGFMAVDLGVARDRQGTCDQAVAVSVVGVCTMFLDFIGGFKCTIFCSLHDSQKLSHDNLATLSLLT